jgi:signal peptidase II
MNGSLTLSTIWRRTWLILAVAAVIIGFDQWTKSLVRQNIPDYTSMIPFPALGEYFVFEHVRNYGAAFGILQGYGEFFIVIAFVVSVAILVYAVRSLTPDQKFIRVLLGMEMGGALGNVIDRIMQGYVTDFVKMGIPGVYYWPNYNIADSAIVLGVIGLAVVLIRQDIQQSRQQAEEPKTMLSTE